MNKRIIVFSPHYPLPAKSGYDLRVLQQLASLSDCYEVILIGIESISRNQWPKEKKIILSENKIILVRRYEDSLFYRLDTLLSFIYSASVEKKSISLGYMIYRLKLALPAFKLKDLILRLWTTWVCIRANAKVFMVNYSWYIKYKPLIAIRLVVEMHDIVCLSEYLLKLVNSRLDEFSQNRCLWPGETLSYESILLGMPRDINEKIKSEANLLSSSDLSIAICKRDSRIIHSYNSNINLVVASPLDLHFPVSNLLVNAEPTCLSELSDRPYLLLPLGYNNPLNTYGYVEFISHVLPCIDFPVDSRIVVTGHPAINNLPKNPHLLHLGFVDSYYSYLQSSLGLIACTNIGTGFQMKLLEAISFAKPVVCFEETVADSIGLINGIIAVKSHKEFADQIGFLLRGTSDVFSGKHDASTSCMPTMNYCDILGTIRH